MALVTMLCTVPSDEGIIEQVAQQFDNAAVGAMATQHQAEDQLFDPVLGDGEVEEDVIGWGTGSEGLVERLLGGVNLLVDELPADPLLASRLRDRFRPGEDLDGQGLPLRREELLGRPADGVDGIEVRLRETDERRSLGVHACLLGDGAGF